MNYHTMIIILGLTSGLYNIYLCTICNLASQSASMIVFVSRVIQYNVRVKFQFHLLVYDVNDIFIPMTSTY